MKRHILHIHNQSLPPTPKSGGSNRLIDWLAKEQSKLGFTVSALSPEGQSNSYYKHIYCDVKNVSIDSLLRLIPDDVTDIEFHGGLSADIVGKLKQKYPKLISIVHAGEGIEHNTVYVSKSHAKEFGKDQFIHNGVPIESIDFDDKKSDYYLFLAKVKRSKKGVATAIKVAKKTKSKLIIAGGKRLGSPETWFPWHPRIKPVGFINGEKKKQLLKKSKALLVPINWEEPFGLTIVEAMMAGTPVVAFNRGAMSELIIHGKTGFLCDNEEQFIEAMDKVTTLDPYEIRKHAIDNFSAKKMAVEHLKMLEHVGNP